MMLKKKHLLLLLSCFCLQQAFAQEAQKSTISQVNVFLNGAQVIRESKSTVPDGVSKLVFSNLSPSINPGSVQVSAEGNATIMSVQYKVNYLRNQEKSPLIQSLEDSLENVNYQLEETRGKKMVLDEERSLLLANKSIGGHNNGVQVAELEDAADFFRRRLSNISEESLKLRMQESKLKHIADKLNQQLAEYNNHKNEPSHEVTVTLKADAPAQVKLQLSYFVYNASWEPFYDIRVKNTQAPVQLFYKARITQNSGENWDNVKIKLSTGNPSLSGNRPILNPAYLNFQEVYGYTRGDRQPQVAGAPAYEADTYKANSAPLQNTEKLKVIQTASNIEFDIANHYSVTADGNPQTVDIKSLELAAKYAYICVPKMEKEAFLVARVFGNNELYQLNGQANIYYEGTYVGQTSISASTNDTLELSLGRDKRIIVDRVQVKEFCSRSKIGSNTRESSTWEISIRNTRKEPVEIWVEDQVPVSQNKDIEVKLTDKGTAFYDEESGKLTWFLNLASGQSQKMRFSFDIKYPKDKLINPY